MKFKKRDSTFHQQEHLFPPTTCSSGFQETEINQCSCIQFEATYNASRSKFLNQTPSVLFVGFLETPRLCEGLTLFFTFTLVKFTVLWTQETYAEFFPPSVTVGFFCYEIIGSNTVTYVGQASVCAVAMVSWIIPAGYGCMHTHTHSESSECDT